MLNIFYGRADIEKDQFMFDQIRKNRERAGYQRTLMIVPDQFTLQAERNVIEYLNLAGMMDIHVISFSRLAFRVLEEAGGLLKTPIDKYGRYMLLSKIIEEENDNLEAFSGMAKKHSFAEMANDVIIEMKQYNVTPEALAEVSETEENPMLARKLRDIHKIYAKYEAGMQGKYLDSEDYLDLFISRISCSSLVRGADIWIDGFDYFTPKNISVIGELVANAYAVNWNALLDSGDDIFSVTQSVIYKLRQTAAEKGIEICLSEIGDAYLIATGFSEDAKRPEFAHIEKDLYAYPHTVYQDSKEQPAVTMVQCANCYTEIETAAASIIELVRDHGVRYKEIALICNDMQVRGPIISRIFQEYGIPFFMDQKRSIIHNPCIEFILALFETILSGWRFEDVLRIIKTGFTPISPEDCERLEDYGFRFKVKGNKWKKPFQYGVNRYGEAGLEELNQLRERLVSFVQAFETPFKEAKNIAEKTSVLFTYLYDTVDLPGQAQNFISFLTENHQHEYVSEMEQVWDVIVGIMDQMVALLGEAEISDDIYHVMLTAGFDGVEIGMIPTTVDQVIVGTMQRTRTGKIKALYVAGANDGILPAATVSEGLLSEDEKRALLDLDFEISKSDQVMEQEERLGIYRTFSKPSQYLWIGYASSDLEGRESKPSFIFEKLRKIFPMVPLEKDLLNQEEDRHLITTPSSSFRHLTSRLRQSFEGELLSNQWKAVYNWYLENGYEEKLQILKAGLLYENKVDRLPRKQQSRLLTPNAVFAEGDAVRLSVSPSRLERFSKCPFAHYISYGLRPEERRTFEVSSREMGDIYHECLMRFSRALTEKEIEITNENSKWMTLTQEACNEMVSEIVDQVARAYSEGILSTEAKEQYRCERIERVCQDSAWIMVNQVQKGSIQNMLFEASFNRKPGSPFPPIPIQIGEDIIYIEGKIDRVDFLNPENTEEETLYVKVIEYKSGEEKFSVDEAKAGYKLQLMIYLKAAIESYQVGKTLKPAGIFYFTVGEGIVEGYISKDTSEADLRKMNEAIQKQFRMDGIMLSDAGIIKSIAGDFSGSSEVVPVKRTKDGVYSGTTSEKLLSEESFTELIDGVSQTIVKLCKELIDGKIDIAPVKTASLDACKYCEYKSVCNYE